MITLTTTDYLKFLWVVIVHRRDRRAAGFKFRPAMYRCWCALNGGHISARRFATDVGCTVDDIIEVFEDMALPRPFDL